MERLGDIWVNVCNNLTPHYIKINTYCNQSLLTRVYTELEYFRKSLHHFVYKGQHMLGMMKPRQIYKLQNCLKPSSLIDSTSLSHAHLNNRIQMFTYFNLPWKYGPIVFLIVKVSYLYKLSNRVTMTPVFYSVEGVSSEVLISSYMMSYRSLAVSAEKPILRRVFAQYYQIQKASYFY